MLVSRLLFARKLIRAIVLSIPLLLAASVLLTQPLEYTTIVVIVCLAIVAVLVKVIAEIYLSAFRSERGIIALKSALSVEKRSMQALTNGLDSRIDALDAKQFEVRTAVDDLKPRLLTVELEADDRAEFARRAESRMAATERRIEDLGAGIADVITAQAPIRWHIVRGAEELPDLDLRDATTSLLARAARITSHRPETNEEGSGGSIESNG
jgi:hypothetical protein